MVRIGLTTTFEIIDGLFSSYIAHDYVNAIIENDAVPVLIPVTDNYSVIDRYLEILDGIMLTGGEDIDPALYNEENSGLSHDVCIIRDRAEMYIIEKSLKSSYPILGICRGFQILNVFFGGTLYQDIPGQYVNPVPHVHAMTEREALHHEVHFVPDSYTQRVFGQDKTMVNSRHHQGVRKPGKGQTVTATSDDGLIEAFEDMGRGVIAVQWHPENIRGVNKGCNRLFQDLVDRTGRR